MSKSGPIRSKLGPALKRVKTGIENINKFLDADHSDENMRNIRNESYLLKDALRHCIDYESVWVKYLTNLTNTEAIEAEQKIYDDFKYEEKHFVEWIDNAREVLLQARIYMTDDEQDDDASEHEQNNENTQENQNNTQENVQEQSINLEQIRLPTLRLPNFNGDPLYWRTFWQSFEPTVHKQKIPKIQKMTYLIGCLQGEALRAVAGFPISNENYTAIVELLEKRYGNVDALTEALQVELVNLPTANESLQSLRNTSEAVERICRQLKDLGVSDENPFVATHIKQKFPRFVVTKILEEEQNKGVKYTTLQIRETIQKIITLKEKVRQCMSSGKAETQGPDNKNKFERTPERRFNRFRKEESRSFATTSTNSNTKTFEKRFPCLFCESEQHLSSKCPKFASREDRMKRLIQLKRCFRCVKEGHISNNCQSGFSCRKCMGKHHILICNQLSNQQQRNSVPIRYTPVNMNNNQNNQQNKQNNTKRNEQKTFKTKTAASAMETETEINEEIEQTKSLLSVDPKGGELGNTETILMARKVQVSSPNNPKKFMEVLVFFDSGSQTSYITTNLVKKLSPPKVGERILEVSSFRSEIPTRFKSAKYLVDMSLKNGKTERLILSGTDRITKGFKSVKINTFNAYDAMDELQSSMELINEEPDILIGVADFWSFFVKKHKIANQFYLIETTVGPIVCGKTELEEEKEIEKTSNYSTVTMECYPMMTENNEINKFWDLESIDINDNQEENFDKTVMDVFENSITQIDRFYHDGWPWKEVNPELPTNCQTTHEFLSKNNPELTNFKVHLDIFKLFQSNLKNECLNIRHFIDKDGIYRIKTCLTDNQIFITKGTEILRPLKQQLHQKILHMGVEPVLSEFSKNYWTPQAIKTTRTIIKPINRLYPLEILEELKSKEKEEKNPAIDSDQEIIKNYKKSKKKKKKKLEPIKHNYPLQSLMKTNINMM
jgi:hypothetical protein